MTPTNQQPLIDQINALSLPQLVGQAATLGAQHLPSAVILYRVWLATHGKSSYSAPAWFNLGTLLAQQGETHDLQAAIVAYRSALLLSPRLYLAAINLALILESQAKADEAMHILQTCLNQTPNQPQLLNHVARLWMARREYAKALPLLTQSLLQDAAQTPIWEQLLFLRARLCCWPVIPEYAEIASLTHEQVLEKAGAFGVLMMSDEPALQQKAVQAFAQRQGLLQNYPASKFLPRTRSKRLRIAYVSSDFHNHATACLMAQVFESHDPARVEIFAYSWAPDDKSTMRRRLCSAFSAPHGGFHEIGHLTDAQAAALMVSHGIDIAVDLKGHTQFARTGIFARRPAPIQVNYLGYPGSMQLPFIDYIFADSVLISPADKLYYSERVIKLKGCYQCNDNTRQLGEMPSRESLGLPQSGRVLIAMNATFKFTPEVVALWMRLLEKHSDTVLWLHTGAAGLAGANANLRDVAKQAGVDPNRLIFAPSVSPAAHLTRLQIGDLFLDNWPCNAHTTASDALWAGVPVLTCKGRSFASRVAASLLHTLGLRELITSNLEEYEQQALYLLTDPSALTKLRKRLWRARTKTDVFDGKAFARKLEAVYHQIWQRYWP